MALRCRLENPGVPLKPCISQYSVPRASRAAPKWPCGGCLKIVAYLSSRALYNILRFSGVSYTALQRVLENLGALLKSCILQCSVPFGPLLYCPVVLENPGAPLKSCILQYSVLVECFLFGFPERVLRQGITAGITEKVLRLYGANLSPALQIRWHAAISLLPI